MRHVTNQAKFNVSPGQLSKMLSREEEREFPNPVFIKVIKALRLIASGESSSISGASKLVGLSPDGSTLKPFVLAAEKGLSELKKAEKNFKRRSKYEFNRTVLETSGFPNRRTAVIEADMIQELKDLNAQRHPNLNAAQLHRLLIGLALKSEADLRQYLPFQQPLKPLTIWLSCEQAKGLEEVIRAHPIDLRASKILGLLIKQGYIMELNRES